MYRSYILRQSENLITIPRRFFSVGAEFASVESASVLGIWLITNSSCVFSSYLGFGVLLRFPLSSRMKAAVRRRLCQNTLSKQTHFHSSTIGRHFWELHFKAVPSSDLPTPISTIPHYCLKSELPMMNFSPGLQGITGRMGEMGWREQWPPTWGRGNKNWQWIMKFLARYSAPL